MGFFKNIGADREEIICAKLQKLEDEYSETYVYSNASGLYQPFLRSATSLAVIDHLLRTHKLDFDVLIEKVEYPESTRIRRHRRGDFRRGIFNQIDRNRYNAIGTIPPLYDYVYDRETRTIFCSGKKGNFADKKAQKFYDDSLKILKALGISYKRKGSIKQHNLRLILED